MNGPAALADNAAIYESPLPASVEADLERLYQSVFASLVRVRSMGLEEQACAFVASLHGEATCVLLFRREANTVQVLNEAIALRAGDIERFASAVFAKYPSVQRISFPALRATIGKLPFPYQQFDWLEDIVLELPPTPDAYFAALGKNMRTSLKRYQKKISADFPGFRYAFYERGDAGEQDLAAIVALSSARISSKNQLPSHTGDKTRQLIRLVKECGVVLVATIDGRVCAGVICTRFGGNVFMHVVAHDPAYDDYRLGKVCCYLSICDAIARGAREYHFLSGRYEYKYRLLGEQRDFDRLVIYRSRLAVLLGLRLFVQTAFRGVGRRVKWWLLDEQRGDTRWARLLLGAWRRLG
ncbi:MAG: GNAT family N-acetyltransferase [Massilia sp.]